MIDGIAMKGKYLSTPVQLINWENWIKLGLKPGLTC